MTFCNNKGSLSQQLSSKGINVSIYNPQLINTFKQGNPYVQSAEKPRNKQNGSTHQNSSSIVLDSSQNQVINQALSFSTNFSNGKKTNSQSNLSAIKVPVFNNNNSQNIYQVGGKTISSSELQQNNQHPLNISRDFHSLLQKKMLSQQHRRTESTKLTQTQNKLESYSHNVSSQKKGENNFIFPDSADDSQIQTNASSTTNSRLTKNQSEMHQKYYSSAQKLEEPNFKNVQSIISPVVSSRSGQSFTPTLTAAQQVPQNIHYTSPLQLTPIRDPQENGRFFLNLAKATATSVNENSAVAQKSANLNQIDEIIQVEQPKFEKGVIVSKSSTNSPNNYTVGDNIIPFSSLIQKNQQMIQQAQQLNSPNKQIKNSKVVICEPKNTIFYEQIQPINNIQSYLPLQSEHTSAKNYSKSANQISSRSEFSDSENINHLMAAQQQYPIQLQQQLQQKLYHTTTPPKVRQASQINYNSSNQRLEQQQEQILIPPNQEEARQQFQTILSTLQVEDQQKLLQELTSLYSSIFHLEQKGESSIKSENQPQQNQQNFNKQYQNSNGNDSTSTSSLDELHGSIVKNKKSKEEKEREEFLKQEEMISLEQQVLLVNYIDINKDELFKLVRDYYQTQTKEPKKYLTIKEEKISLFELLSIQKWIQEKLLERIDEEKKARLKTEEQTSQMLLNQEKTIKVMEGKWQQQYDQVRNGSTLSNNTNCKRLQSSPNSRNSPVNISDAQ